MNHQVLVNRLSPELTETDLSTGRLMVDDQPGDFESNSIIDYSLASRTSPGYRLNNRINGSNGLTEAKLWSRIAQVNHYYESLLEHLITSIQPDQTAERRLLRARILQHHAQSESAKIALDQVQKIAKMLVDLERKRRPSIRNILTETLNSHDCPNVETGELENIDLDQLKAIQTKLQNSVNACNLQLIALFEEGDELATERDSQLVELDDLKVLLRMRCEKQALSRFRAQLINANPLHRLSEPVNQRSMTAATSNYDPSSGGIRWSLSDWRLQSPPTNSIINSTSPTSSNRKTRRASMHEVKIAMNNTLLRLSRRFEKLRH